MLGSANARVTTLVANVGAAECRNSPSKITCMTSLSPVAVMVPEVSPESAVHVKICILSGPIENDRGSLVEAVAAKAI